MNILVLMPMYKIMDVACVQSLVGFQSEFYLKGDGMKFLFTGGFNAAMGRRALMKGAVDEEWDHDYVLWLDSDHFYRREHFDRLVASMKEHNLPMLSGAYKMRGSNETAHGITIDGKFKHFKYDELDKEIVDCQVVGFGFLVMTRDFVMEMWNKYQEKLFILDAGQNATEDVTFCRAVTNEGYRVCFHRDVRIGHVESALRV